jgi:hypothetical protein
LSCFLTQVNTSHDNLTRLIAQHRRGPAAAPPAATGPPAPVVASAQRAEAPGQGRGKRGRRK